MAFGIELGAMVGREALINNERYWTCTEGVSVSEVDALRQFIRSNVEDGDLRSLWEHGAPPAEIAKAELNEVTESIQYCKTVLGKCSN
jgi:hypothetical protein